MGWQERELTPGAGPREFLGYRLRTMRQDKQWSLQKLSDAIQVDYSYLGKVERADQLPHRDVIVRCDTALGGNGELPRLFDKIKNVDAAVRNLDGVASPGEHVANHVASLAEAPGPNEQDSRPWEEQTESVILFDAEGGSTVVTIPRRALAREVGRTNGGIILPGQVTRDQQDRLKHTPLGAARPIERLERVRKTLTDMDNLFGPQIVIPKAMEQLNLVQQLAKSQRGKDLQDLLRIQTQYADLLGWLHQDSGAFGLARYWLDRALEWAHVSRDGGAVVFIMSRKAQLAADMDDPITAASIADAAIDQARSGSPLAAIAATYSARGHALAGEEMESLRGYDQANNLLVRSKDDQSPWGKFFGAAYIDIQRSHSLIELGRYSEAATGFRAAINELPDGFHRDEGVYLAWEARAHAGNRDPEQAVTLATEALRIGLETKSSRIITELINLNDALSSWKDLAEVHRFRATLNSTIRKQA